MKKLLLLFSITLLFNNYILSQDTSNSSSLSRFAIHLDGSISGYFESASVNIEGRIISSKSRVFNLYANVGYAYLSYDPSEKDYTNGGITYVMVLVGKNRHYFEGNIGTYIYSQEVHNHYYNGISIEKKTRTLTSLFPILNLGYRYQKPQSGLFFRAKIGIQGIGGGIGYAF